KRRHVDYVYEHRALLGVVEHANVEVGVIGGRDRDQRAVEVAGLVLALLPANRALERQLHQLRMRFGRDQRDVAVTHQQPFDLLEPDFAPADHHAAPAAEAQAGDVERRLEHVLHAGLVADPLAQLAYAFLAAIGLGGHAYRVLRRLSRLGLRAAAVRGSSWQPGEVPGRKRHTMLRLFGQ